MIIDKKGKLFGKISIIDIILVLAVIFVVIVLAMRMGGQVDSPFVSQPDTEYTVRLKATSLDKTDMDPFHEGEKVYSEAGELIGTITKVEFSPYRVKQHLASGESFDFENSDYSDYIITVEGLGTVNDSGVMAEGTYLLIPGNSNRIASKYFNGNAIVLSVEK